jgi:hypothetical protein
MNVQKTHKDFKWIKVIRKTATDEIFGFNKEAVTNEIIIVQTIFKELAFEVL